MHHMKFDLSSHDANILRNPAPVLIFLLVHDFVPLCVGTDATLVIPGTGAHHFLKRSLKVHLLVAYFGSSTALKTTR